MQTVLATKRYWLPILGASLCFLVSKWVSPIVAFVLIMLALGLLFDVATAAFAKAGGIGGVSDFRQ